MEKAKWTGKAMAELLTVKAAAASKDGNRWLETAICRIHERQTYEERVTGETVENNGIGWNAFDAPIGTRLAAYAATGRYFTGAHRERALRMAIKYRNQLAALANEKAARAA